MALITSFTELKAEIINWLDQSDVPVEDVIRFAESQMRRDFRARKLATDPDFVVDAAVEDLPADFYALYGLYHPVAINAAGVGTIETLGPNEFGDLVKSFATTGSPRYAVLEDTQIRFLPTPDTAHTVVLQYWARVPYLTIAAPTNWMLEDNPDIYLYGSLMQTAAYIREDTRYPMWKALYEAALNELNASTKNRLFGGKLRRKTPAIGG